MRQADRDLFGHVTEPNEPNRAELLKRIATEAIASADHASKF